MEAFHEWLWRKYGLDDTPKGYLARSIRADERVYCKEHDTLMWYAENLRHRYTDEVFFFTLYPHYKLLMCTPWANSSHCKVLITRCHACAKEMYALEEAWAEYMKDTEVLAFGRERERGGGLSAGEGGGPGRRVREV